MRNLMIGAALAAWFVLVMCCVVTKHWPRVVCLFCVAWLVEQAVSIDCDEE